LRRAALQHDLRCDIRNATGGIEQSPDRVPRLQQQQRAGREVIDIDHAGFAEFIARAARRQDFVGRQHKALESRVARVVTNADVNLAALQHRSLLAAERLE
jgi:hypothetical protein